MAAQSRAPPASREPRRRRSALKRARRQRSRQNGTRWSTGHGRDHETRPAYAIGQVALVGDHTTWLEGVAGGGGTAGGRVRRLG